MPSIILPAATQLNLFLYITFGILAVSMGPIDYFGVMPMRYSKFRTKQGIPSRFGMFFFVLFAFSGCFGISLALSNPP